jgi:2,5-diketo-D-gluconate reductase A
VPTLAPTLTLRSNLEIPVIGLGTWPMRGDEAATAVRTAIQTGYRLVDTAENYENEDGVGRGIAESGVPRDEIVVTTKFNKRWHSVDGVAEAFRQSCQRLGVDYIDVLMVHWPNPGQDRYVDALRGLGRLLANGDIRAIGVSNFKPAHLRRVIDETDVVPDLNQIQLSPYHPRADVRAFDAEQGIVTESWSPIGASSDSLRSDPVVTEIASRHGKSTTQTVLRWHVQLGLVAIPKSGDPGRMAENLDIFDFELSPDEMATISGLERSDSDVADSDQVGH